METESGRSNFRSLSLTLDETCLSLRILELDGLDAADVVEVTRVLIVRNTLWEASLCYEVTGLLVEVLLEVASNDDIHAGRLANLVGMEAEVFVRIEHVWSEVNEQSLLLVCD